MFNFDTTRFDQRPPRYQPTEFGRHAQGLLAIERPEQWIENAEPTIVQEEPKGEILAWTSCAHSALDRVVVQHFDVPALYPTEVPRLRGARKLSRRERQLFNDVDVLFFVNAPTERAETTSNVEQIAKNADALALIDEWIREAELGIDPEEAKSWSETKAAIDKDRFSTRKLFP